MIKKKEERGFSWMILFIGLIVILQLAIVLLAKSKLYFIVSSAAYLWFHLISEVLTILIGFIIFYYANKSYKQTSSNTIRIIGWAFLAMAIIDIFHTLAYKGFPSIFFLPGSNVAIWFWLPARFIGVSLLLISSLIGFKKVKSEFINYLKYIIILFVVILIPLVVYNTFNNILPKMFIDGQGLTSLKVFLEYFVMVLFGIAALIYTFVLYKNKNPTLLFFIFGLISSVFSEFAFTLYTNVFDVFNMLGHGLKVVAYIFFLIGLLYSIKKEKSEELK